MDPPSKPAKMSCHGNTPNPHANVTRQIHEPKIPPSLLKIPRKDTTCQPPPPLPPRLRQRSEGGGGEPTRPAYASCTGTFAFPSCLHILTGHNIYTFYIERVNKYKMYCFRRRKNCKEVVRSWSPPGPIKGSVLHNLEYYRRPAG